MDDRDLRPIGPGWVIVVSLPGKADVRLPLVGWTWSKQAAEWLPTYFDEGQLSPIDPGVLTRAKPGARLQVVADQAVTDTMDRHAKALRAFGDVAESHTLALRRHRPQ